MSKRGVNPSLNVNYNQTNVVIGGPISNIQIGCNNTIYSRPMTRSQQPTKIPRLSERQKEMYNTMKDCKDEVNQEMMVYLSKGWSRSWKRWARYLSIRDEGMTNICDSFTEPREAAYQMIKYWKQKTRDPSVGNFVTLLTIKGEFESIIPLFKDGTFKAH